MPHSLISVLKAKSGQTVQLQYKSPGVSGHNNVREKNISINVCSEIIFFSRLYKIALQNRNCANFRVLPSIDTDGGATYTYQTQPHAGRHLHMTCPSRSYGNGKVFVLLTYQAVSMSPTGVALRSYDRFGLLMQTLACHVKASREVKSSQRTWQHPSHPEPPAANEIQCGFGTVRLVLRE